MGVTVGEADVGDVAAVALVLVARGLKSKDRIRRISLKLEQIILVVN